MSAKFLQNNSQLATPQFNFHCQPQLKAFSLIEFMVASVISMFLITAMMGLYVNLKKVYLLQQALQNLQENGRFASFYLKQQLNTAGFVPCVNAISPISEKAFVHGYSKANAPDYLVKTTLVANSDILVINKCAMLNNLSQLSNIAFYIANTTRTDINGEKVTALYEKIHSLSSNQNKTVELIPNVARMEINYGIANASGDIDNYVIATNLINNNWQRVKAVHIALWLNSDNSKLQREWDIYIHLKEAVSF